VVSRGACRPRGAGRASPGAAIAVAPAQSLVVTATRQLEPAPSLRDAWSSRARISRPRARFPSAKSSSAARGSSCARPEGRAAAGPLHPRRGTAQTLVLVDGLRVSSATIGTTSIENIPVELIERIEVVKGSLSSLYGSDAIGGVVQIFTRGRGVPHFFGAPRTEWTTTANLRGIAAVDERSSLSLSTGARKVDAPSATNPRAFGHNPDRDPHENLFANLHTSYRMWQDELVVARRVRDAREERTSTLRPGDDRNEQTIAGASSRPRALSPRGGQPLHARLRRRQDRRRSAPSRAASRPRRTRPRGSTR
jgi:vitamin B12 transporter